jgi:hypothetical protein
MFQYYELDDNDYFATIIDGVQFEELGKGRIGTVLVDNDDKGTPIVRTTSSYINSPQVFTDKHHDLIEKIKEKTYHNVEFNNGMLEIYNESYRKMKFHTDQSLDLAENSYICLFTCYEHEPSTKDIRTLVIRNKVTSIMSEIKLNNNSIVIFSYDTNLRYNHKIIKKCYDPRCTNRWLGFTLRLSKTFVNFVEDIPYIMCNDTMTELRMATDIERRDFYKMKSEENRFVDYVYDELDYTLSPSDTIKRIE